MGTLHLQYRGRWILGIITAMLLVRSVHAQVSTEPLPKPKSAGGVLCEQKTIDGFAPLLPLAPQKNPRSAAEVAAFLEHVGTNDSIFEVVVGQGRLMTLKKDLAEFGKNRPLVAVGDPAVIDFAVVGPRQIRVIGQRIGRTDLSITTTDNQVYSFEVLVVADLQNLRTQLKAMFPDAALKVAQIRDHVVVEGQARDSTQVGRIIETIKAYLISIQSSQLNRGTVQPLGGGAAQQPAGQPATTVVQGTTPLVSHVHPEQGLTVSATGQTQPDPRIINLIRVVGPQQVLLKVRVAELNRTCLRQIGADFLGVDPATGTIYGTQIAGGVVSAVGTLTGTGVTGAASGTTNATNPVTTVFGIFQKGNFELLINALRQNSVLKILAEPNLITLNGHPASFLAGGEFPVPIPQFSTGGVASNITVQFREFGVRLGFVPYILDGDVIRLSVDPEVSNVDFALGTVLVPGGTPVPGLNTRKSHTTVELREGQTLAIAGLLQVTMDGTTRRIPLLGDLPIIGTLFSGTNNSRVEKELVVMVTPYLVQPMCPDQVPPTPGDDVGTPGDLEFYLLRRIESRSGRDFRSTLSWDDPLHLRELLHLEQRHLHGPCGFSE